MPCRRSLWEFYFNALTGNGTPLCIGYVNSRKLNNDGPPANRN